ncbi:ABC transporter ATPase [Mucilaginibacter myungsuensis]|uniref:ABC transporter ATPase n=1 Tax=Mucilaginibacter myungsuensis TaxID=649104 RepID=A0A929PY42_9SPHI|nr:ABC transporter ATPase [Mucilaginibacter myungsuensis]MBE9664503.1 ABC transporter ATPase [Mucilaginibacter myungsuensis]MDN3601352.1 ABC transporter ATPase [Mucilaginibacter myungsuensis]
MQFSENSRVWVYQSNRELTAAEAAEIQTEMDSFTISWTAHSSQLKAKAEIRYNRFLILIVDESQAGASGCSIDKSVHFMQHIEQKFGISLFDRFNLAYRDGREVLSLPRQGFEDKIKQKQIGADTIVFNNMVQNLKELNTKWEVPFKDSWHIQLFDNLLTDR